MIPAIIVFAYLAIVVYIGTEDGDLIVLEASKTMKEVGRTDVRAPIYASPVVANKTLYVATPTHLYAVDNSAKTAGITPKPDPRGISRMERRAAELREEHRRVAGCVVGDRNAHMEHR